MYSRLRYAFTGRFMSDGDCRTSSALNWAPLVWQSLIRRILTNGFVFGVVEDVALKIMFPWRCTLRHLTARPSRCVCESPCAIEFSARTVSAGSASDPGTVSTIVALYS